MKKHSLQKIDIKLQKQTNMYVYYTTSLHIIAMTNSTAYTVHVQSAR